MNDELKELIELLSTADPHFKDLSTDEKIGYVFAMRWSRFSKISGMYNNLEILIKIQEYFNAE